MTTYAVGTFTVLLISDLAAFANDVAVAHVVEDNGVYQRIAGNWTRQHDWVTLECVSMLPTNNIKIAPNRSRYIAKRLEVSAAITVEIGAGGALEIG